MIEHSGIAAPIMVNNLEVDQIASPIINSHLSHGPNLLHIVTHSHVKKLNSSGHAAHAFYTSRFLMNGSENPNFILNQEPYRNASILLSGANFGIGSMQIMATTRLLECGIKVIIASSFGPTFFEDSVSMGLLPLQLSSDIVNYLAAKVYKNPNDQLTINLEQQVIFRRNIEPVQFSMNERVRDRFIHGSADSEILNSYEKQIELSKKNYLQQRPWIN